MQIGQKVKVYKVLKPAGEGVSWGLLTEDQEKMLEEDGFIRVHKNKEVELKSPKEGILVGTRRIGRFTDVEYYDTYHGDGLRAVDYETEKVYLVAVNLSCIYKVRPEGLEVLENA